MDRRKFLTVAGSGTLLGLTGCGGCGSKGGNVIKIVSSMPRTGSRRGRPTPSSTESRWRSKRMAARSPE